MDLDPPFVPTQATYDAVWDANDAATNPSVIGASHQSDTWADYEYWLLQFGSQLPSIQEEDVLMNDAGPSSFGAQSHAVQGDNSLENYTGKALCYG